MTRQVSQDGRVEHRFEASSLGRIRRVTTSVYDPEITVDGYERVRLGTNGGKHAVHRLVASAFGGEAVPKDMHVNHIDNDRRNNAPTNLEVVSCAENIRHAYEHGNKHIGERHNRAKLSDADVDSIRSRFDSGESAYSIWMSFPKVGYGHIKGICSGRYRNGAVPTRLTAISPVTGDINEGQ